MKRLLLAGALAVLPALAFAQSVAGTDQGARASDPSLTAAQPRQAGDEMREVDEPAQLDRTMQPTENGFAEPRADQVATPEAQHTTLQARWRNRPVPSSSYGKVTPPDGSNSGQLVPPHWEEAPAAQPGPQK